MSVKRQNSGQETDRNRGFSLIELLIVVAIILIIAAIAIPNLLRAKIAANQASAVQALRTMTSAEQTFSSTFNDGYTLTMQQLGGPVGSSGCNNAGLIDEVLSTAPFQKSGYGFVFTANGNVALASGVPAACGASGDTGYSISATPVTLGSTGTASYCVDETGVIRVNSSGVAIPAPCANSGFPPLQ
ncbi:MAG: prepilin-type N-terminal cleavage/methylation domain-containing protein [Candidatus Acidiferrales bacterium]